MNGIFLNEEEKMDDLEFLGEVLEIREAIDDADSDADALQKLLDENKVCVFLHGSAPLRESLQRVQSVLFQK